MKFALIFLTILCFATAVSAGLVQPDKDFNSVGFVAVSTSDPDGARGEALGIKNNGSIVLGGFTIGTSFFDRFATIQTDTNGALDTTFGGDGIVIDAVGFFNHGTALAIQPDGKILLGGDRFFGSNREFVIIRYLSDGTFDNSFSGDGIAIGGRTGFDNQLQDLELLPDGRILAAGFFVTGNGNDMLVERFTSSGLPDTSQGPSSVSIDFGANNSAANSIEVLADGSSVVGGFVSNGNDDDAIVVGFQPSGSFDMTYGNGGFTVLPSPGTDRTFVVVKKQSDGKILAGGSSQIRRFNTDGSQDTSFGSGGVVSLSQTVQDIFVREDDSFYVSGGQSGDYAVSRYLSGGSLDTSFNDTGTVTLDIPGNACSGNSIAIQNDQKIVVGGACFDGSDDSMVIARFVEESDQSPTRFDFDGDGKADVSVFRRNLGEFWYLRSSDGIDGAFAFGSSTDQPVPADFTGDGIADFSFWRPSTGEWFVLRSDNTGFFSFPFGADGDIPAPGDFDGDGTDDAAVFRPSSGTWFILRSSDGQTDFVPFGAAADSPLVGDYDGDGTDDVAVYKPDVAQFWQLRSTDGLRAFAFGQPGDIAMTADFSGDGSDDMIQFRPSTGFWNVLRSEDDGFFGFPFGANGDIPAAADYDGDGTADPTGFRPSDTTWYSLQSTNGATFTPFGIAGDEPLPGTYNGQ